MNASPVCLAPLVTCLLAAAVPAQLSLQWEGGFLDGDLTFELSSEQLPATYVLLPSLLPGPTPLSLFDPSDDRVLGVGLDLLQLAQVGLLLDPSGASETLSISGSPTLAGLTIYAQALTLTFVPSLVGEVSNEASLVLGAVGDTQPTVGDQVIARRDHTATTLLDGRVLLAGGHPPGAPAAPLTSLELYDPVTQTFQLSDATLPAPRAAHTATLLADGRVLLLGGYGGQGVALLTGVLYDPDTDSVQASAPMLVRRVHHTATRLPDGRVVVVGGSRATTVGHPIGFPAAFNGAVTRRSELYDPDTNAWTQLADLPQPLTWHEATLTQSGRVLVSGGVEKPMVGQPTTTTSCHLLDPASGQVLPAAALPEPLAAHHSPEGPFPEPEPEPEPRPETPQPIVLGGADLDFGAGTASASDATYGYDEQGDSWSLIATHPGIVMCREIVCKGAGVYNGLGGLSSLDLVSGAVTEDLSITELDTNTGQWTVVGSLSKARPELAYTPVDGFERLLVTGAGASGGGQGDTSAECYLVGP